MALREFFNKTDLIFNCGNVSYEQIGQVYLEEFFNGYVGCAIFCGVEVPDKPVMQDDNFTITDLTDDAYRKMLEDCLDFIRGNVESLEEYSLNRDAQSAGQDFWLTRNGHGTGFWDHGLGKIGTKLTTASKPYGSCSLWYNEAEKKLDCQHG